MQSLYYKLRAAITSRFPDYDLKTEFTPDEYQDLYDCRFVVNSGRPFAIHLAKDGRGKLMVSIFPALFKDNHAEEDIYDIFTNYGIRFTTDDSESFMINAMNDPDTFKVFHLTQTEDSVDEYILWTEEAMIENIIYALERMNKKGGAIDSGG